MEILEYAPDLEPFDSVEIEVADLSPVWADEPTTDIKTPKAVGARQGAYTASVRCERDGCRIEVDSGGLIDYVDMPESLWREIVAEWYQREGGR